PVGEERARVAEPGGDRSLTHPVGAGVDAERRPARLDRHRQRVAVIVPAAQVLEVMEPPRRIAVDQVEVAVAVEVAGRYHGMPAEPHLARLAEDLDRSLRLVPGRP